MNTGDVVIPIKGRSVLRCGSGEYTHAICVQVEPFILVSQDADMLWSATVEADKFTALCQAHPDIVKRCTIRAILDGKIT